MWDKIKIRFTKHEMWALTWAERLPFFALFFATSLWVWMFLPVLLISPALIFLIENWPMLYAVISLFLCLPLLIYMAPWFFRWYFICVGLMFGRGKMASSKRMELVERLKLLTET
ncbi:MAG: hypothetical protein AAF826_07185 [Pseudomonadota bacterium]